MKILHISKKYPPALGGDAVVVSNLQKQQQAAGHDVVIVTSNCDEIAKDKQVYKIGLKDTPAQLDAITPKRLISLAILFFQMFAILRKEQPDVIHTHSIDMAFFVSFAARFYSIPLVHTFHIVTFYDKSQSLLRRKSELWLAKRSRLRRATAPNAYDVKKLRAAGLEQTTLLPNGVDQKFWEIASNHIKGNETFEFISVGRLEHQKGHAYLIKAVALLAGAGTRAFRVTIVGEGSQEPTLRELARTLHVEDMVTLAGRKNPEEVRTLLTRADAAVFPSLYETTPITLLEAWAASLLVIATPVGILRDVPDDFGAAYIVAPKDEQALSQVMSRCMTDAHGRLAIAAKGSEEAKKYAWPLIAQKAQAIYRGAT